MPIPSSIKPVPGTTLEVIAACSNPRRYESRYRLFREFVDRMDATPGVRLWTIELAYGGRAFEVTSPHDRQAMQVRSEHELWHKENLINVAARHLTYAAPGWQYLAWIDADVTFLRPDWAEETIHQLQHHGVVQLWSDAIDLGPRDELVERHKSFAACYLAEGIQGIHVAGTGYNTPFWHPGYAWACTRQAWDGFGGLIDATLGAADMHMACALVGEASRSIHGGVSDGYRRWVNHWQTLALRACRKDLGCVSGTIAHHWHGRKVNRGYQDRWSILTRNQYDPYTDVVREANGLIQLVDHQDERSIRLRDEIRAYFASRNEDSIDLQ